MGQEPVVAFDVGRMLFGDEPPLFLLEIAFRTVVIYVYTLVLIRWVGSRSIAQLSLVEFLLVIALGSAVGDAMFYPDVPLIHCMVVITVVICLDKLLGFLLSRSPAMEDAIEGRSVEFVRDGIIDCARMRKLNFGHDELFEQLRLSGVSRLGQVRAAYLETNGKLSVFTTKSEEGRPSLSIDPPWDVAEPARRKAGQAGEPGAAYACASCGTVAGGRAELPDCPRCGGTVWHPASEPEHA
jgi:uncharacterized membrane protein YcaP (DUF421 family)